MENLEKRVKNIEERIPQFSMPFFKKWWMKRKNHGK